MKIAVFGRTELRCSICVLLLVPAAAVLGKLPALMLALVSLAVHELSHAFMAARLGLVVSSIEVQPFGFIAELHTPPRTPSECLSVAAAGPFASLLTPSAAQVLANTSGIHRQPSKISVLSIYRSD